MIVNLEDMMDYRKLWESTNGVIPKDDNGFSYEIHHIDGDHNNNDISNLKLVSIREHLQIHLDQEDWFAAALISRRLGLGSDYSSKLQTGKKRPGIGGVPKGTIPWNKNKKNCFDENTINKFKEKRKGNRYGKLKVSDETCLEIIKLFNDIDDLEDVGCKSKNGKILTKQTVFAKKYCSLYNISAEQLFNIITGKRNVQF